MKYNARSTELPALLAHSVYLSASGRKLEALHCCACANDAKNNTQKIYLIACIERECPIHKIKRNSPIVGFNRNARRIAAANLHDVRRSVVAGGNAFGDRTMTELSNQLTRTERDEPIERAGEEECADERVATARRVDELLARHWQGGDRSVRSMPMFILRGSVCIVLMSMYRNIIETTSTTRTSHRLSSHAA
jgi:hypothetical protein